MSNDECQGERRCWKQMREELYQDAARCSRSAFTNSRLLSATSRRTPNTHFAQGGKPQHSAPNWLNLQSETSRQWRGVDTDNVPENVVFLGHTVKLLDLYDDSETIVRLVGEAQAPTTDKRSDAGQRQQPDGPKR